MDTLNVKSARWLMGTGGDRIHPLVKATVLGFVFSLLGIIHINLYYWSLLPYHRLFPLNRSVLYIVPLVFLVFYALLGRLYTKEKWLTLFVSLVFYLLFFTLFSGIQSLVLTSGQQEVYRFAKGEAALIHFLAIIIGNILGFLFYKRRHKRRHA